jgi:hypothetical protein
MIVGVNPARAASTPGGGYLPPPRPRVTVRFSAA